MRPFDHHTPLSLTEALSILGSANGQAAVIAGGSDLLLKMKDGELAPELLINIKRLPELKGIHDEGEAGVRLGALTTLRELTHSPIIRDRYPVLSQTASLMASEQIRCFATLGGNLCNAAPSADLAPPLIALGAEALLIGPGGERRIPLGDFFIGPGLTTLNTGELLKEIFLPPPAGETVYLKHSQRVFMDIALVGVAVRIVWDNGALQQVRILLGAVAPVPLRALRAEAELVGWPLSLERIEQAARVAADDCAPIDDVRCTGSYRRRMVHVLLRRILVELADSREAG